MRTKLHAAIAARWDARRARHPTWGAGAWAALLRDVFLESILRRGLTLNWRTAVLQQSDYLRALAARLVTGHATELPARVAAFATAGAGSGVDVPSEFGQVLDEIVAVTQELLLDAASPAADVREVHETIVDFIGRALAPRAAGKTLAAMPAAADPLTLGAESEDAGYGLQERHAQGASIAVESRYRRVALPNGDDADGPDLWLRVEYMHMSSVTTRSLLDAGTATPEVGRSGTSGNASTPHCHTQLTLWAVPPEPGRSRPVAVLSPLDVFGPVTWEGAAASGPSV